MYCYEYIEQGARFEKRGPWNQDTRSSVGAKLDHLLKS